MFFELRTIDRGGGGPREAERLVQGRVAAIFQTEVGEAGQTLVFSPLQTAPAPTRSEGREGRFPPPELPGRIEVLEAAPFMPSWEPREMGRVWELSWWDFLPGGVPQAMPAFAEAVSRREAIYPIAGCWSVDIGPNANRIYVLAPYRDWDHRDEVTAKLRAEHVWPPRPVTSAEAAGSRLLLPAGGSALR